MTTEAETKDLEETKAKVAKVQEEAFDMMKALIAMDITTLGHCGHKTHEAAIMHTLKDALKSEKKLWTEFLKRWPDK